jgi:glycosyltransferase involved in cell wall biosynthesis
MAQDPLHVLWIEPSFPGRLGTVADWLVQHRGYRSTFYCNSVEPQQGGIRPASVGNGLTVQTFNVGGVARDSAVTWSQAMERSLCYAYGCGEVLEQKRPLPIDLIVGRSAGLGSSLFAPVYYPRVPVVSLVDYYWHAHRNDLADDARPERPPAYFHWRRSANAIELLDLEQATLSWTNSKWQRSLFPAEYRESLFVQHDGIDARRFSISPWHSKGTGPRTIDGRSIPDSARVVSFVARSLERLRGFDRFWMIADALIRSDPNVLVLAIGDPITRRGLDIEYHNRELLADLRTRHPLADSDRFWIRGPSSAAAVQELLAASDLHLAPSRVYPVARSVFQTLSSGGVVLASDTPPHREVITDGRDGFLIDGDDHDAWVRQAQAILDDPAKFRPIGDSAARLVRERYSHEVCLARLAERFTELALGRG